MTTSLQMKNHTWKHNEPNNYDNLANLHHRKFIFMNSHIFPTEIGVQPVYREEDDKTITKHNEHDNPSFRSTSPTSRDQSGAATYRSTDSS